ncbi:MAG: FHA domain-containing protein, partial [Sandaracinaceae bacterium]|nr:FHA domain-containing protein [Sandaracinaceae bacterium]
PTNPSHRISSPGAMHVPSAPPSSVPPPLPSRAPLGGPPPLPGQPSRPQLYVIFNGQKFPITKDEFIIGRGSKTADLLIKDGNISRRHAAIIYHNGAYYIKDLGSTNGIEYKGQRIESRRIEEGDVYHLCDYEIRFTFR